MIKEIADGLPPMVKTKPVDYRFARQLSVAIGLDPETSNGAMCVFMMFAAKHAAYTAKFFDAPGAYDDMNRWTPELRDLHNSVEQATKNFADKVRANKTLFRAFAVQYDKRFSA